MQLIGLSFSMCVLDILKGKVNPHNIDFVIGAADPDAAKCIEHYSATYWRDFSDEQILVATTSIGHKYFQFRGLHIPNGYWIDSSKPMVRVKSVDADKEHPFRIDATYVTL